MNFDNPQQALRVLGLDGTATREDIKSAYHKLAVVYHPDSNDSDDNSSEAFLIIQGAYEYLMNAYEEALNAYMNRSVSGNVIRGENVTTVAGSSPAPRIIGSEGAMKRQAEIKSRARERMRQEKRMEKAKKDRIRAVDERLAKYRQDMEYEEAMKKIHAIRAAEITLQLYEASLRGTLGSIKSSEQE